MTLREYIIFNESRQFPVKILTMKYSLAEINSILKQHREEICRRYRVKEIGVFGSFVRGEEKKRSDVDILVEYEVVPDLLEFIALENYLEKLLIMKVDLVRKTVIRPELKDIILNEVVYI